MSDSQFLVFLHPEIIPHLQSLGLIKIFEINESKYMTCSTIKDSPLPGFLDITIPRIEDDQDFDFAFSLPIHYIIYVCWASADKILGFCNSVKETDTQSDGQNH